MTTTLYRRTLLGDTCVKYLTRLSTVFASVSELPKMSVSTHCVVFGCPNKGTKKKSILSKRHNNKDITFFKFPLKHTDKSLARHNKWLKNINRESFKPLSGSVVCSFHFTPDLFMSNGRLNNTAVPTLHMGSPPKYDKCLVEKGVQCEMGKETYRSQPGVNIACNQIQEEFGDENEPTQFSERMPTHEVSAPADSNEELFESFPMINVEDIKEENGSSMAEDDHDVFTDVQCNLCTCGECGSLMPDYSGTCCNQMNLRNIIHDLADNKNCITFHESFSGIVLDIHAIMTRIHSMIVHCPPEEVEYANLLKGELDHRLCRHVAYHQFLSWVNSWGNLGIDQIKSIPACVSNLIRQKFPDDDNKYRPLLRDADIDQEIKLEYYD